jgi:hypothetical protein
MQILNICKNIITQMVFMCSNKILLHVNNTVFLTYMHNFLFYFDMFRPNKRPKCIEIE